MNVGPEIVPLLSNIKKDCVCSTKVLVVLTQRNKYSKLLTGMCDREAVGGLEVVNIVIEVKRFLCHILVGVVQLDSKPEGAVLLHCRAHEQSTYRKENVTY